MNLKTAFALFCSLLFFQAQAQRPASDLIETKKGPLSIQPILHGTVVLQWDNKTIYVDPYGGAQGFEGLAAPDLILITDIHGDHLDPKTLEGINTSKAIIVAPQAVADQLPASFKGKAVVISNGGQTSQLNIPIRAVPMYNYPESPDSRHPKGRGNGYVLNLGGKNVYLSGDTGGTPEIRTLKNIDVAFVCMNEPFTMSTQQAADAVLAFKPKVIYPYHYRGPNGLSDVEGFKKIVNEANGRIDVRLRQWYPGT
jgi:L-ascorbate metabolism protein UlaG (beta-lactamase superfamily)